MEFDRGGRRPRSCCSQGRDPVVRQPRLPPKGWCFISNLVLKSTFHRTLSISFHFRPSVLGPNSQQTRRARWHWTLATASAIFRELHDFKLDSERFNAWTPPESSSKILRVRRYEILWFGELEPHPLRRLPRTHQPFHRSFNRFKTATKTIHDSAHLSKVSLDISMSMQHAAHFNFPLQGSKVSLLPIERRAIERYWT